MIDTVCYAQVIHKLLFIFNFARVKNHHVNEKWATTPESTRTYTINRIKSIDMVPCLRAFNKMIHGVCTESYNHDMSKLVGTPQPLNLIYGSIIKI